MTRTADEWQNRSLGSETHLVVGWRIGTRHTGGARLDLHVDLARTLRERAAESLAVIGGRSGATYSPSAMQEPDEVFLLQRAGLPQPPVMQRRRSAPDGSSDLLSLLDNYGALANVPASDLRGRDFLFYAVVVSDKGERPVAFIKRRTAAQVLSQGRLAGVLGQTVVRLQDPVMLFADDFDLVVDGDELAVLGVDAVERLFVNLDVVAAAAPQLASDLQATVTFLDDAGRDQIAATCRGKKRLARRLQLLLQQPHLATLTLDQVIAHIADTMEDADTLVADGELVITEDTVSDIIEALEQCRFRGAFDNAVYRADRRRRVLGPRPATRRRRGGHP